MMELSGGRPTARIGSVSKRRGPAAASMTVDLPFELDAQSRPSSRFTRGAVPSQVSEGVTALFCSRDVAGNGMATFQKRSEHTSLRARA